MIYLDNAATSGVKPMSVINAVNGALVKYSANPGRSGHKLSLAAAELIFDTRHSLKEFFGCDSEENVVFTLNCTHAVNTVIKGALKAGDHVITSDLEHNAVMRPLEKLKRGNKITYDIAKTDMLDDEKTVENFKKLITPKTRIIICTGGSNVLGHIMPIGKIGDLCKEKGILFAVDAAQTAGVVPINMQKQNIDFLCIAAHKGLYAPMGVGVLIARKQIANTIIEGGTGTASLSLLQPEEMPERLESGTQSLPLIAGVKAGVEFVKQKGIDRLYSHEFSLLNHLYNGLQKLPNTEIYSPPPRLLHSSPVVSFNIKNKTSNEVAAVLNQKNIAVRAGLHCAPSAHKKTGTLQNGSVRVSLSVFNTKKEIDYLVNVLKFIK